MVTILITGVAGFIGSSLAEKVINDYQVVGLDDFNDYYSPKIKEKNIACFINHKNFRLYRGDIRDEKILEKIFTENKIDKIVHLAARAGVRSSLANPILHISVNVTGTQKVLKFSASHHVKQFIFASSSSVYGNNSKAPFFEEDFLEKPISPYAISKIASEKFCWLYHYIYDVPVTILRFFSVYGPRGRPDMAPFIFTKKIFAGKEIEIFGDGSQARDFTYIDDIVNGIIAALDQPFNFETINLGNSHPISVASLVKTIGKITGKKAVVKYLPARPGDVERTFANIDKAKKMLKWEPRTNIKLGLTKFVQWFLSNSPPLK